MTKFPESKMEVLVGRGAWLLVEYWISQEFQQELVGRPSENLIHISRFGLAQTSLVEVTKDGCCGIQWERERIFCWSTYTYYTS